MNIAVDIDDTLTDTYSYFRPFTAEFFGISEEELDRRGISYSNLPAEWKKRETEFLKKYCDAKVPATPFKADAAQGVAALRKMGHRIVIITGRTPDFYTDPYATTREELRRGGIEYDKLVCTLDKGSACRSEHIDLMIDDLPANCLAAKETGAEAFLFDSPVNHTQQVDLVRVHSWDEAVAAVRCLESEKKTLLSAFSTNGEPILLALPRMKGPHGEVFSVTALPENGKFATDRTEDINFGYGKTHYLCCAVHDDKKTAYYSSSATDFILTIPRGGRYTLYIFGEKPYITRNSKEIPGFTVDLLPPPDKGFVWEDDGKGTIRVVKGDRPLPAHEKNAKASPAPFPPLSAFSSFSEAEAPREYRYGSEHSAEEEFRKGKVVYTTNSGVVVGEIHIVPKGKKCAPVTIGVVTDTHLNVLNEKDKYDPEVQFTDKTRYWLRGGASVESAKRAFDFAAHYDALIVTGDIIDYLSFGALDTMKEILCDPYPDGLFALGGHDVTRNMESGFPDAKPLSERQSLNQSYRAHDIFYTSRLVTDSVLCIQMDNGSSRYWNEQVEKLSADLALARENGYTVLLFQHEPLATGNPEDTAVPSLCRDADSNKVTYNFYGSAHIGGNGIPNPPEASVKVYNLITQNADIIGGIFCGHRHYRYYTEIKATDPDGNALVIPQYVLRASAYEKNGYVTKIVFG